MTQRFPGGKVSREYLPRQLRQAMLVTRLANADQARLGKSSFRYIIEGPIHEARNPENIWVLDSMDGTLIDVPTLIERLPESLKARVLAS